MLYDTSNNQASNKSLGQKLLVSGSSETDELRISKSALGDSNSNTNASSIESIKNEVKQQIL
jgi:hypothetical protein